MPSECVKVIVRVRPFNQKEKDNNSKPCINVYENTNSIEIAKDQETKRYTYDYVFGLETSQLSIYEKTAFNLVESVAEGYNGTIFAYGQTGCGKTYTMIGEPNDENNKGIIPRTFDQIMNIINIDSNRKYLLRCSYIEIYNEEIHDLLSKDVKQRYELKEGSQGLYVKDLNIVVIRNLTDLEKYMQLGTQNRSVGSTAMNKESSRSHCIFTIYMERSQIDDKGNERITAGKLNLVDLAGSERQSKTQATGDRLKEATKINLSLSALGNVISALVDGKISHIPYRDSKLTRLLQDSLGGNTKTIMIAAISPSDFNFDETLSSLRYASRAKMIKNQPKVNEDPKDAMLKEQAEEIKKLKEMLSHQSNIDYSINNKEIDEFKAKNYELIQEKEKFQFEIQQKEQQANQERQARERLELLLKEKEQIMFKGGKGSEDEKKKYKKLQQTIANQKKEHELLIQQQDAQQQEMMQIETKFQNVQEELEKLRKQVKYFKKRCEQLEGEQQDLKQSSEYEKEDLLDTIRTQDKEVKLYSGILKMMLSQDEIEKIIKLCSWNDESVDYFIPPFNIKGKQVNLPNLPYSQAMDLIDNDRQERQIVITSRQQLRDTENNKQNSPKFVRRGNSIMNETQSRINGNSQHSVDKAMMVVEKIKQNQYQFEKNEIKQKQYTERDGLYNQQKRPQKVILNPIDNRGSTVPNYLNQYGLSYNNNGNNSQLNNITKSNTNQSLVESKPPIGKLQQKLQQY